jgi:hypothetical protein
MRGFLVRVRDLLRLVLMGRAPRMWRAVTERLYSDSTSVGLRRDLGASFAAPGAKRPVQVRPIARGDDLSCLDVRAPGLSDDDVYESLGQWRLLESRIRTCYVAVGADGELCYMQWLILSSENDLVRAFFGNLYPRLAPDEALLEGAYTPAPYRGQGIMANAMAQIAERAGALGARWVVTFVDEASVASLKGCARAGFAPYVRRHEAFRLFWRRVWFTSLTPAPAVTREALAPERG